MRVYEYKYIDFKRSKSNYYSFSNFQDNVHFKLFGQ